MLEKTDALHERWFHKLLRLCRITGITRLGDLTGLDRIGLPVVQAVRPAALSEVTSLGRGYTRTDAAIGAIMESLERFYAESIPEDRTFRASATALGYQDDLLPNVLQPGRRDWQDTTIPWINGIHVATGSARAVPLELVHTRYTEPPPSDDGLFIRTTAGLACHKTWKEAVLHGLLECIERDAIARAFATHGFFDLMRIPSSGLGNKTDELVCKAAERGVAVAFWYAASPAKMPVVWCQTVETGPGEPVLALPTEGYSAGPSIDLAASNALLEALATRVGAISGTRDDLTRKHYRSSTDMLVARARKVVLGEEPSTSISIPEFDRVDTFDVSSLAERIAACGLGPVVAVSVASDPAHEVECVRTVLMGAHQLAITR